MAVLTGKFTALKAYVRKEKKPKTNNLVPSQETEKDEQNKPKASRTEEIIIIRAVINEMENRKIIGKNQ